MTDTRRTHTLHLTELGVPAARLPLGLVSDVLSVLEFHGLNATAQDLGRVLHDLACHTDADRGGRLYPDGRVDYSDSRARYPDLVSSFADEWYCRGCRGTFPNADRLADHPCWARTLTAQEPTATDQESTPDE